MSSEQEEEEKGSQNIYSRLSNGVLADFKLEETHLLCVDPLDKQAFSINLGTGIVSNEETKFTEVIKSKIDRQYFILNELLKDTVEDVNKWAIMDDGQASQQYRRSLIHASYLQQESQQFQKYIDKSDLSENLAENYKQNITVFICEEIEFIQNDDDLSGFKAGSSFQSKKKDRIKSEIKENGCFILPNVSLLQSADQVIDKIRFKFHEEFGFNLNPLEQAYILKFKNCDSYLYGADQLLYY